jgi:hypothetical protein
MNRSSQVVERSLPRTTSLGLERDFFFANVENKLNSRALSLSHRSVKQLMKRESRRTSKKGYHSEADVVVIHDRIEQRSKRDGR